MKKGRKRFFIFVGGGIGDVLMTTPMFRAIREHYPDAYIGASVMGSPHITILKNNKNVDDVINLGAPEYQGMKGTWRLIRYLRRKRITHSIMNHVAEKKRFFAAAFFAGIRTRLGQDRTSAARERTYKYYVKTLTHSLPYTLDEKLSTQRNLEILRFLGINNSDITYDLAIPKSDIVSKPGKTCVGIHPGCDGRAELKRWEIEKFIGVAERIRDELDYEVKFYIGPAEADLVPMIKGKFTMIEGMPLADVITDISYCDYFISNDSGLAHISGGFGIPTIMIFGPTLHNEYKLPAAITVENKTLECRPCFHLRRPCPIDKLCLRSVTVNDVFAVFTQVVRDQTKISDGTVKSRNVFQTTEKGN